MEKKQSSNNLFNLLKKNASRLIFLFFLLVTAATFLFALSFMNEGFRNTKESGYKIAGGTVAVQGGTVGTVSSTPFSGNSAANEAYAAAGIKDVEKVKWSNYHDFYVPAQEVNRFLLLSSVVLLFGFIIIKFNGSTRRNKFYPSNFVSCGFFAILMLVFSVMSLTKLNDIKNRWEKNVQKGVVSITKEYIEENNIDLNTIYEKRKNNVALTTEEKNIVNSLFKYEFSAPKATVGPGPDYIVTPSTENVFGGEYTVLETTPATFSSFFNKFKLITYKNYQSVLYGNLNREDYINDVLSGKKDIDYEVPVGSTLIVGNIVYYLSVSASGLLIGLLVFKGVKQNKRSSLLKKEDN